jgi:hypothetical protein
MTPNHKKLLRVYREENLRVRRRGGRKRPLGTRAPMVLPDGPNQCKARFKNGPFPGLKRGQSLQRKSLYGGRVVIGVGEAAVA